MQCRLNPIWQLRQYSAPIWRDSSTAPAPLSAEQWGSTLYVISGAEGMTAVFGTWRLRSSRDLECSRTGRREPER